MGARRGWRVDHLTVGMAFATSLLLFTVGRFFFLASHATAAPQESDQGTAITIEHFAVGRRLGATASSSANARQRTALETPIRNGIACTEQFVPLVGEVMLNHRHAPKCATTPGLHVDPAVCTTTLVCSNESAGGSQHALSNGVSITWHPSQEGVSCTEACEMAGLWFARHRPGEG